MRLNFAAICDSDFNLVKFVRGQYKKFRVETKSINNNYTTFENFSVCFIDTKASAIAGIYAEPS